MNQFDYKLPADNWSKEENGSKIDQTQIGNDWDEAVKNRKIKKNVNRNK